VNDLKALIIAAGFGNRLWSRTQKIPKTLLPFGNGTILSTIMDHLEQAGIDEFVLVVGYNADHILRYLEDNGRPRKKITIVQNNEWERGNGLSVLIAEKALGGAPFILSMSDHIVPVSALKRIIVSDKQTNLLLVDKRPDQIFDIDDATKVWLEEDTIVHIGKEIEPYNAIDCGIFRLDDAFFASMRRRLEAGQESISAAVQGLIADNNMKAVFLNGGERWIDIDTPEAYRHALENQSSFAV